MSTPFRKILVLAANPKGTTPLRLDEEIREIQDGLNRSQHRDRFVVEQRWAVRIKDVRRALLDTNPQIIHFAGHGMGEAGLVFEDIEGGTQFVDSQALANLFGLFAATIECVVLNGCYSADQAELIAQKISSVVGMTQAIADQAAIEFAVGFYDALGAGRSVEFAYKLGCSAIDLVGVDDQCTPVLLTRPEIFQPEILDPKKQLEAPEGQVPLNSLFYIERPPVESECYEAVKRPGALIRVKAPRQMGKSSLLSRILDYAEQQGAKTAHINFQSADAEFLTNIDQFLQWFCVSVASELDIDDQLGPHWEGVLGAKNKCTKYFQRYLLRQIDTPLVLGLDEVDQAFQHPEIATDFFGLLRAWHERSKNDLLWQKLKLVIVHSKEVYIPLNINQSPFNVGLPIELPKLTKEQVTDLVQRHLLNWSDAEIEKLMGVADGHPYLLREALYQITQGKLTLEQYIEVAPKEDGLYGNHLHRHLVNLKDDPILSASMRQVVNSKDAVRLDPSAGFKLRSMGLVELQGNDVVPLCNLYREFFLDRLGE